jgi:hypothetical protein
MVIFNCLSSRT